MRNKNNNLDILAKCAICENSFEQCDFIVLEEQDQKTTFHATCAKCKTSTLIFLTTAQGSIVGLGVATDLDGQEVRQVFGRDAISADEVIDMHELISACQGNMSELVKKSKHNQLSHNNNNI